MISGLYEVQLISDLAILFTNNPDAKTAYCVEDESFYVRGTSAFFQRMARDIQGALGPYSVHPHPSW